MMIRAPTKTMEPSDSHRPILDYSNLPRDPIPWQRALKADVAGAITALVAIIGLLIDQSGGNGRAAILTLPLYAGSIWYGLARCAQSNAPTSIYWLKLTSTLVALVIAPWVLCSSISPFDYAAAYGWTHRLAFGNPLAVTLLAAIALFAAAGGLQLGMKSRQWLRRRGSER